MTYTNNPVRAATAGELVKFRANGNATKLNVVIHKPATVLTCRVNQATIEAGATTLTIDTITQTSAPKKNMTVLVSALGFGQREKGVTRLLDDTSIVVDIKLSNPGIAYSDNDYITIIDEVNLFQRDIRMENGVIYMDSMIPWGSITLSGLVMRLGGIATVLKRTSGTATFVPPNPSSPTVWSDATVASYLFEAPSANTTTSMTSPTAATWTYNTSSGAAGYRWSCQITDSNGSNFTAYRRVFVDPPEVSFELNSCSGDFSSGDWSFSITVYDDIDDIYDRALVVLYADDIYNGTAGSIGKLTGHENIVATGWIDGSTIQYDSESSSVTFTVRGAVHWLSRLRSFPIDLVDTSTDPTSWNEIKEMTVDKALAYMLYWSSTAPIMMDCFFSGSTTRLHFVAQPASSLMEQVNAVARNTIFAAPAANAYNQLFCTIDQQVLSTTEKSGITEVMEITTADREDGLEIEFNPHGKTSMLELGGTGYYDGTIEVEIFARAPGVDIAATFGAYKSMNGFIFADYPEIMQRVGALFAFDNQDIAAMTIRLAQNNRLLDIAPHQHCKITVAAADNVYGLALTNQLIIPRRISYEYDAQAGSLTATVSFELQADGVDGVEYYPPTQETPVTQDDYAIDDFGDFESEDFPNEELEDFFPPTESLPVQTPCTSNIFNSFSGTWDVAELRGDGTLIARCYFPCTIRADNIITTTTISGWRTRGDADSNYNVYGVKAGARVITASTLSMVAATFKPVADVDIDYFEMELASGIGSDFTYIPLTAIGAGTVQATDSTGFVFTTVAGQYYCCDEIGGSWNTVPSTPGRKGLMLIEPGVYVDNALDGEIIIGSYFRKYYQAPGTSMACLVNDAPPFNNTGSMDYVVRNVRVDGRRIELGSATIKNVCNGAL